MADLAIVVVTLSEEGQARVVARAQARFRQMPLRGPLTPDRVARALAHHSRGVAGEQAVLRWCKSALGDTANATDVADTPSTPSDIEITTPAGVVGVEVKTTTELNWRTYGRAIDEEQLWTTNAELYVWCVVPGAETVDTVRILGWSTRAAVKREHTSQQFRGPRNPRSRPLLEIPVATTGDPAYDLDDPGFDEFERYQAVWSPDPEDPPSREQEAESMELKHAPIETLDSVKPWHPWIEGSAPRPGLGFSDPVVRVTAEVCSMATLPACIEGWRPEF